MPNQLKAVLAVTLVGCGSLFGQPGRSAYRALGQPDLRHNSVNRVEGAEMFGPMGIALDRRAGRTRVYVADARNHRVLCWLDAGSHQAGDPPQIVLGQATPRRTSPLGLGVAGFNHPAAIAVDPGNGNIYVADSGNHRVLRFPDPFAGGIEPDAVFGQPNFDSRTANPGGISRMSMNGPLGLAFDPSGNLWVSDSGNNRILRFPRGILNGGPREADVVLGQQDFVRGAMNRGEPGITGAGFASPRGVAFDQQGNMFAADHGNARVLMFRPPFRPDSAAVNVYGQSDFVTRTGGDSATFLQGPAGLAVSDGGLLYVASPGDHRVMVFPVSADPNPPAVSVLGQPDFFTKTANAGTAPRASANTLAEPSDVRIDLFGNVFVSDAGNNRVLMYAPGSRSASQVWGQLDFHSIGPNQVEPGGMYAPGKVAIDYSREPFPVYVSDTNNHRVLGWKDSTRFRNGDPADVVVGQSDLRTGLPNESGNGRQPSQSSLSSPRGIAADAEGNLWVADSGNNRLLRFPRPVDQGGRIVADLVVGQHDFTSAMSVMVAATSLRQPSSVAIANDGTLFVADTGNNRVLEYEPGAGFGAAALRVYGQPDFFSAIAYNGASAQTLSAPLGVAVDASLNLYVADTGANRVVIFPNVREAPATGTPALIAIGAEKFDEIPLPAAGPDRFSRPVDVALGMDGELYVADAGNHRVLLFPSLFFIPVVDAEAIGVVGQRDFMGLARNWNTADGLATAEGLAAPAGIYVDRMGTLYVADAGNNRVTHYLRAAHATHAANPQASTTPRGGLAFLAGDRMSGDEATSGLPLAHSLAGREVVINDEIPAPLFSVTPSWIGFQAPSSSPVGTQRIAVRTVETGELIAGGTVSIGAYSPGLYAEVRNQDGTVNSGANAAAKGSVIELTGTGQGPVSPAVPDGEAAPDPPPHTIAVPTTNGNACLASQPSVCVALGNVFGEIQFSGLAPGKVGTWLLKVRIPAAAQSGTVPVRAVINGQPSNLVTVAIQ